MKFTIEWLQAAFIRMIRTAAQVALSMFTIGMAISDVDWKALISVSLVAAVYSFLTSIVTNLPEIGDDGTIKIENGESVAGVDLNLNGEDYAKISKKGFVKLKVDDVYTSSYQPKH